MLLKRQVFAPACIVLAGLLALSACSSSDSEDDAVNDETASDSDTTTDTNTTSEDSPASALARATINNGYYLSRREDFNAEGLLVGGVSNSLNASENLIEVRDIENEALIDSVYRYDPDGNLTSVSFLSPDESLAPIGDEIQTVSIEQENGALQVVDVDYLVGAEVDYQITYTYDDEGKPVSSIRQFVGTDNSEQNQYNYENGVLVSVTGTDIELAGVIVTDTITRDEQGRVSIVDTSYEPMGSLANQRTVYSYDQNDNVSEMSLQTDEGAVLFREVYTYEATQEPVFNLINYYMYFQQQ